MQGPVQEPSLAGHRQPSSPLSKSVCARDGAGSKIYPSPEVQTAFEDRICGEDGEYREVGYIRKCLVVEQCFVEV